VNEQQHGQKQTHSIYESRRDEDNTNVMAGETPQKQEPHNAKWLQSVREDFLQQQGKVLSSELRKDNIIGGAGPSKMHRVGKIDFTDSELKWEENSNFMNMPQDSTQRDQMVDTLDFAKVDWTDHEDDWTDEPTKEELNEYSKQSLKKVIETIIQNQRQQTSTDGSLQSSDSSRSSSQKSKDQQSYLWFVFDEPQEDRTTNSENNNQQTAEHQTDSTTSSHHGLTTEEKASRVRAAFEHAWNGYSKYAWGHDEINPVSKGTNDSWGKFGATLVDALDTLFIMGFRDEFEKAKDFVRRLDFNQDVTVSFFETTIRHVGGLLGAYDLSGDKIFLQKASELADRLLPAFNTPSGLPYHEVNLRTGEGKNPSWTSGRSILAEVGSFQLEFKYLSHHTGKDIYWKKATHAMKIIRQNTLKYPGLYPLLLDINTGNFTGSKISWGGLGDSFYEYELKQYLLTNKNQQIYRRMYSESIVALEKHLLKRSIPSRHLYVAEMEHDETNSDFEHLACFIPGMLVLGAQEIPERKKDYKFAVDLMETCVDLYISTATGLAPDHVSFNTHNDRDYVVRDPKYMLRPETVESLFYLYKYTGSEWYRRMAWKIFLNIEQYCKTEAAFSGIRDVTSTQPQHDASMQSFFLAETLKYLYLIFVPDVIDLQKTVFTTEAHILTRFDK